MWANGRHGQAAEEIAEEVGAVNAVLKSAHLCIPHGWNCPRRHTACIIAAWCNKSARRISLKECWINGRKHIWNAVYKRPTAISCPYNLSTMTADNQRRLTTAQSCCVYASLLRKLKFVIIIVVRLWGTLIQRKPNKVSPEKGKGFPKRNTAGFLQKEE